MKTGYQGSSNPCIKPMEQSIENAVNIVVYQLNRLIERQGDGAGFLAMLNDFQPEANNFLNLTGAQTGDKEAQVILTADFESEFSEMAPQLDGFDSLLRIVHAVGTTPYNLVMGRTRDRFYHGSYEMRIAALLGMSNEMTAQTVPDGATAVIAYRDGIILKHATQSAKIGQVGNDGSSVNTLRNSLIKKLNKNRGWLLFNYAMADDCEEQVNKFYPTNIMGDRSIKGHYQLIVPKVDFRKVCIHIFKADEMIDIEVGDADVWLSTADNANNAVPSGYKAVAHSILRINPSVLGDLTKKYIIATNVNMTTSTDLIFNIVKV